MSRICKSHSAEFKAQVPPSSTSWGHNISWVVNSIWSSCDCNSSLEERCIRLHDNWLFREAGASGERLLHTNQRTACQDRLVDDGTRFFSRCLQTVGIERWQERVDSVNRNLSIVQQSRLLNMSRSGWYYESKGETPLNLSLMRMMDEQFLLTLYDGSRQMVRHLRRTGYCVRRKCVRRLRRLMGLKAIDQSPQTSVPNSEHALYPYLLNGLDINQPNQVVYGYHLYPHKARIPLSGNYYGLVEPKGSVVADFQYTISNAM